MVEPFRGTWLGAFRGTWLGPFRGTWLDNFEVPGLIIPSHRVKKIEAPSQTKMELPAQKTLCQNRGAFVLYGFRDGDRKHTKKAMLSLLF